jgi:hypothetical protein
MVSAVVKVLEMTMTRVVSGSRPWGKGEGGGRERGRQSCEGEALLSF